MSERAAIYQPRLADAHTRVRAGVGVFVRDAQGRVLLEKRSDSGLWGAPGGRIEPGESIQQAAVREVMEETGLTIGPLRLIGAYSNPQERIVTYPDNVVHLVDVVMEAEVVGGELTLSSESEQLQFFAPDALPAEIVPAARQPLLDWLAGRTGVIA